MIKFAIYTFLGFILESVYVSILKKQVYFSGLLKGPFIPIYGFGALLVLQIAPSTTNNYELFFYALVCCTTLEYLTHYFLQQDAKIKIWDYSQFKCNFAGRICLFYSLMWGILAVVLVNYLDPFINMFLNKLNPCLTNLIAFVYFLIILYQFYHHQFKTK